MSDALINTPTDNAPLYALQYIEHSKYPTFQTSSDSLIVIATSSSIFMVKASEWKRIVGLRSAKGKGEMFNTTPFLWSRSANNVEEQEIISKMKPFEVKNMEVLYEAITMRCRFRDLAANFAADGLRQTLPGPASPGLGIALGTPLALVGEQQGKVLESSNPPTRRGGRLRRGRAGQALGTMGRGRRSCKETDKKRNEVDNISDGTEERQNE